MFSQAHEFRQYLKRRQDVLDSEESKVSQIPDLFNEKTFYKAFTQDLLKAEKEVIIYSPFVSKFRTDYFKQTIEKLRKRNVEIFIFTRPVNEHEIMLQDQIECALNRYIELGVSVCYLTGSIHEKVSIIDREILWEGSLNILSQRSSREIMRRTHNNDQAMQLMSYLGLNKILADEYKLKYEKLYRSLINSSEHNLKVKTRIFVIGCLMPILIWLFIQFIGMISSSSGIQFIISLVKSYN